MAAYLIDAGTDIACVGIWDAGLPPAERPIEGEALNASAARGEVLPIHTSADGSYLLRILVEEPFVPPEGQRFVTLEREFGLELRLGTALVGGCEDFQNPRPEGGAGLVSGVMALLLMVAAFWSRRRLARTGYGALHRRYQSALEAAHPPTIVLELHRVEGPLPGGSGALEDTPGA
ncbi:hypothetical protein KYC5002_04740 [Archangium violaceum]|uniref:hypothetical protein n=1 Tax=Archangium violaceum TaxID=83451 RepID=UPI002B2B346E|nr:hypothetical protein KYC5002_04740 [Archangium gephyra]